MSVSSEEINLLVQHYLQELGFEHTAFSFGCESKIPSKPIASREIPPGSLVYLVQKGIMYAQMEAAADEAATSPETLFGHQLNILRSNIRQSTEIAEEISSATKRIRILPTQEQTEPLEFYLSSQSSLILQGHSTTVLHSAWNYKSDLFATCSTDGTICIWNFRKDEKGDCLVYDNPQIIKPFKDDVPSVDITFLCWSNIANYLVVGTFMGHIIIYKDGQEVYRTINHTSPIVSISFNPSCNQFAAGSADGMVSLFSLSQYIATRKTESGLMDVQWISDNTLLISAGMNVYKIVDSNDSTIAFKGKYNIIQLCANRDKAILGDDFGNVLIFDKNMNVIKNNKVHNGNVTSIAWETDNNQYVTCGADGGISIDSLDGKTKVSYKDCLFAISCIAIDPKGRYFAAASSHDVIYLYSKTENKLLLTFESIYPINHMSWSGDGRSLAICLDNGDVSVIDFEQIC